MPKLHMATNNKLALHPDYPDTLLYHSRMLCPVMALLWCDESTPYADPQEWADAVDGYNALDDAVCCDGVWAMGIQRPLPPGRWGDIFGGAIPTGLVYKTCGRDDRMPAYPNTLHLTQLQSFASAVHSKLGQDPFTICLGIDDSTSMTYDDTMNGEGAFTAFEAWLHTQWPDAEIYRYKSVSERWLHWGVQFIRSGLPDERRIY